MDKFKDKIEKMANVVNEIKNYLEIPVFIQD